MHWTCTVSACVLVETPLWSWLDVCKSYSKTYQYHILRFLVIKILVSPDDRVLASWLINWKTSWDLHTVNKWNALKIPKWNKLENVHGSDAPIPPAPQNRTDAPGRVARQTLLAPFTWAWQSCTAAPMVLPWQRLRRTFSILFSLFHSLVLFSLFIRSPILRLIVCTKMKSPNHLKIKLQRYGT